MLVPFDTHTVWLRTIRLRSGATAIQGKCSVAIRSLRSAISIPAQTPRMLNDVYRTLSFGVAGTPR